MLSAFGSTEGVSQGGDWGRKLGLLRGTGRDVVGAFVDINL